MSVHPDIIPYGTPHQQKVARAVNEHGSTRKAAKALGIDRRNVQRALERLRKTAAERNVAPDENWCLDGKSNPAPEGFHVKRKSVYTGVDGNVSGWTIMERDKEDRLQAFKDMIADFADAYKGLAPRIKERKTKSGKGYIKDRCVVYPLGDPHFGMHAWCEETGTDFDLKIAERNLEEATQKLVEASPPTEIGVLVNLGDFFHADGVTATTHKGTRVDVDTRWPKVFLVGYLTIVRLVEEMLMKHREVHVYTVIGNHDTETSMALSVSLMAHFHNNPRAKVHVEPTRVHTFIFGKVMLAFHHGDTLVKNGLKSQRLIDVLTTRFAEDWGKTRYRYAHVGHYHHVQKDKEHPGIIVESHRTLAGTDAWHAAHGYLAGRHMQSIEYHQDHGEVSRMTVGLSMLE